MVKKGFFCTLIYILVIICIGGCGSNTADYVSSETESVSTFCKMSETEEPKQTQECGQICVYVCGAVAVPGVYILDEGSRVCDLFQLAGGLTELAAEDYWNQARLLVDGEMLYVPTKEEAKEQTLEQRSAAASKNGVTDADNQENKKVNINTATIEELMTLPGIGESKALAIVSYREENGGFSSIDELKEISGIKDGVFSKIEDYIVIY